MEEQIHPLAPLVLIAAFTTVMSGIIYVSQDHGVIDLNEVMPVVEQIAASGISPESIIEGKFNVEGNDYLLDQGVVEKSTQTQAEAFVGRFMELNVGNPFNNEKLDNFLSESKEKFEDERFVIEVFKNNTGFELSDHILGLEISKTPSVAFELIKHNPEILSVFYESLSPEQYKEAVEMLIEKSPQSIAQYESSSETLFGELVNEISDEYGTDLSGLSDKYDKIKLSLPSDASLSSPYQTAERADKTVTQFAIDEKTGRLIVDGELQSAKNLPLKTPEGERAYHGEENEKALNFLFDEIENKKAQKNKNTTNQKS